MRLNIGAGNSRIEGFDNWDIKDGKDARKLPFPDGAVDEIYASHVLEHFSFRETADVLKEWVRVLKPGGRLRIAVPDFDIIVNEYLAEKTCEDQLYTELYLMGDQKGVGEDHRAIFQEQKLRLLMEQAGLGRIGKWKAVMEDCASLRVSLNLEGYKGAKKLHLPANCDLKALSDTHVVITLPRICWTDPAFIINPMCARLRMSMTRSTGVFWDQKITASLKDALTHNPKYLLTWDYDTICTDRDVICLHEIMEENPDVAVLFPQQIRREGDTVMMTVRNADGTYKERVFASEFDADLFDVNTGHFGLTFIRAESLRKMPEPWFIGATAPDGTWGDNHTDPDISFWYKCHEYGLRTCCAPQVSIGHLQLMVTWPTRELKPIHQNLTDWEKKGKPEEAI